MLLGLLNALDLTQYVQRNKRLCAPFEHAVGVGGAGGAGGAGGGGYGFGGSYGGSRSGLSAQPVTLGRGPLLGEMLSTPKQQEQIRHERLQVRLR